MKFSLYSSCFRLHTQTEENLKSSQVQLGQIEGEVREVRDEVSNARHEKQQESKHLKQLNEEINGE